MPSTAEPNPYESFGVDRSDADGKSAGEQSLPTFCRVVFTIDGLFCLIRGILVFVALAGLGALRKTPFTEVYQVAIYELVCSAGIAFFGTSGNVVMLLKQDWGKYLGYLNIFATVGALFCAYVQFDFALQLSKVRSQQQFGMIVSFTAVVAIRLALLGVFIAAIVMFSNWKRRQSELRHQLISKYLN